VLLRNLELVSDLKSMLELETALFLVLESALSVELESALFLELETALSLELATALALELLDLHLDLEAALVLMLQHAFHTHPYHGPRASQLAYCIAFGNSRPSM